MSFIETHLTFESSSLNHSDCSLGGVLPMFILKISNAYNHLRNIVPDNDFQTYYQKYNIHPLLIAENAQCSYLYAKFHLKDSPKILKF